MVKASTPMPKKPETKFAERVVKLLDKIPLTWHFKAQLVARRGIPDRIICCNGNFVAWELKVESPLSALQKHNLELIDKAKGVARVVTPDNLQERLLELYSLIGVHDV